MGNSVDIVKVTPVDFAFVSAKLHGMRSKLYEGPRIDVLTSLRNAFEMMASVFPDLEVRSRTRFERHLTRQHVRDLRRVQMFLQKRNRHFLDWQLERYRIENLKVVLRGWKSRLSPAGVAELLVELPEEYSLPVEEILGTDKLIDVIRLMPVEGFGRAIRRGTVQFHDTNRLFYIEAALDAFYFEELCRRAGMLRSADRDEVNELLGIEVLIYEILFIMRARLNYEATVEDVREFLVKAPHPAAAGKLEGLLRGDSFDGMLAAMPQRKELLGPGPEPTDLGELQRRTWERLYLAANRVFYRSMFHMGCVEAFYYIKRVELANLIRVAELLKQELSARDIQRELIRLPEK